MSRPTVTVIIPAYRAAATICRAVESVLGQTRPPDQVLVIDDGSPDDLSRSLARYGDAVTLIAKANGGAASARNVGMDRAAGDWIAFLDADDYWERDKLERQFAATHTYPDVGFLASRWFDEPTVGPRRPAVLPNAECFGRPLSPMAGDVFTVAMLVWTSTVLVRRDVLGGHRFLSGLEPAEDRDLWLRLLGSTRTYLVPEPLATYVETPGSLCRGNTDRDCGNMLQVVRRHAGLLGPSRLRREEAVVYRQWAAAYLGRDLPGAAVSPAAQRLARQPTSLEAWWVLGKSSAVTLARRVVGKTDASRSPAPQQRAAVSPISLSERERA